MNAYIKTGLLAPLLFTSSVLLMTSMSFAQVSNQKGNQATVSSDSIKCHNLSPGLSLSSSDVLLCNWHKAIYGTEIQEAKIHAETREANSCLIRQFDEKVTGSLHKQSELIREKTHEYWVSKYRWEKYYINLEEVARGIRTRPIK